MIDFNQKTVVLTCMKIRLKAFLSSKRLIMYFLIGLDKELHLENPGKF